MSPRSQRDDVRADSAGVQHVERAARHEIEPVVERDRHAALGPSRQHALE